MNTGEQTYRKDSWEYVQNTKDFTCINSKKRFNTGECFDVIKYRIDYDTFICQDKDGEIVYLPENIAEEAVVCPWKNKHATAV
jgi:hypothetical protein